MKISPIEMVILLLSWYRDKNTWCKQAFCQKMPCCVRCRCTSPVLLSRRGSAGRRRRREEARWFFACRRREEDFLLDAAVFLLLLCRRSVCSRPACCVLFFGDSCTIHTILILLRSFAITFVFGGRKGVSSSKKYGYGYGYYRCYYF